MYSVDIYSRVRRACLRDGMSARDAARYFSKYPSATQAQLKIHEDLDLNSKKFINAISKAAIIKVMCIMTFQYNAVSCASVIAFSI